MACFALRYGLILSASTANDLFSSAQQGMLAFHFHVIVKSRVRAGHCHSRSLKLVPFSRLGIFLLVLCSKPDLECTIQPLFMLVTNDETNQPIAEMPTFENQKS